MRQVITGNEDAVTLAKKLNSNFAELYQTARAADQPMISVPFGTAVNFGSGPSRMTPQSCVSAMNFTAAPGGIAGGSCLLLMTSDGVHIPTLDSAFRFDGGSPGWISTVGVVNAVGFHYDALGFSCTILQSYVKSGTIFVLAAIPVPTAFAVAHGTNPTLTITVGGANLNTGDTPAASAFTIASTTGRSSLAVTGVGSVTTTSITLNLTGTATQYDTLLLGYTPPATTPLQDASGNQLAQFSGAAVTVS